MGVRSGQTVLDDELISPCLPTSLVALSHYAIRVTSLCMEGKCVRVLFVDIETTPNLAHVWSLWNQNVSPSQLIEPARILCFAAKWLGENRVMYFSEFHDGRDAMAAAVHELLDQADVVVGYNSKRFDVPHINAMLIDEGYSPPSPYKHVDLWRAVKAKFHFPTNRMDYVCRKLGIPGKVKHGGHDLWVRCMAGDEKAWNEMRRYNRQDVKMTEALYLRLLPWIPGHPNMGLYVDEDGELCPRCGGNDLERRGFATTLVGKFQRFQCKACGGWSRGARRVDGVAMRSAE